MADSDHVVAPRFPGFQPYDPASDADVAGGWVKLDTSGPADSSGDATSGDFEDGPGPWRQT